MAKDTKDINKKKNIKAIISYVVGMIALVLCIYIVTEVIIGTSNKRPPRVFGLSVSYVPTGSMEPTIETKSYVLFRSASYKECKMDDIIVYYNSSESKYIIHRVIGKVVDGELVEKSSRYDDATNIVHVTDETNYLITMGDNNGNKTDTIAVTKNLVYGKYITGLGFMNIFSSGINPFIIYSILIVIFVIMIGIQTFQLITKKKIDDAKKQNEDLKEQLIEDLRKQVLEEELAKLRANKENTNNESVNDSPELNEESDNKEESIVSEDNSEEQEG